MTPFAVCTRVPHRKNDSMSRPLETDKGVVKTGNSTRVTRSNAQYAIH